MHSIEHRPAEHIAAGPLFEGLRACSRCDAYMPMHRLKNHPLRRPKNRALGGFIQEWANRWRALNARRRCTGGIEDRPVPGGRVWILDRAAKVAPWLERLPGGDCVLNSSTWRSIPFSWEAGGCLRFF